MGNWVMIIKGSGFHDNNKSTDAETLLRGFVTDIRKKGQSVVTADFFVFGSHHDCEQPYLGHKAIKE